MRIVKKDLKQGEVKLVVEALEDLWYLSQLIDPGDTVKGKTLRRVKATEEAQAERRPVFLAIAVEKVEFSESTSSLRAGGVIVDGPEDVPRGAHHTFSLEPGTTISIVKQKWLSFQLDRLTEAAEAKQSKILLCLFDREEALFALMKRTGPNILAKTKGEVQQKRVEQKQKGGFYESIIKQLENYDKRYDLDHILVASPAFWKEELMKVLRNSDLKKKIIQATCSGVDERSLNEVMGRDEIKSALHQDRISKELAVVEEVMATIAKSGAVSYGLKNVSQAATAGAISKLVVTDGLVKKLRSEDNFAELDSVFQSVDSQKGEIMLIPSDHDGGTKLDGIGGVAAILRYKLE